MAAKKMTKPLQYSIDVNKAGSISELIEVVQAFELTNNNNRVYFRGEDRDYGARAFTPGV